MTSVTVPEPPAPNAEFAKLPEPGRLERAKDALVARGFTAEIVEERGSARKLVLEAIPEGSEVHVALSETMRELGLTAEIDESGRYDSIRQRLLQFDRATQFREMRKMAAAPDYVIGSAGAVTEEGEVLVGSASGSQIGAYAYTAGQVILVVGHQKVVSDIAMGMRRIREYCLPLEFERVKSLGGVTALARTLILHGEYFNRIRVILIRDSIGF